MAVKNSITSEVTIKMARMMTKEERKRWYRYHKRGGHNLSRCKINQFNVSSGDSFKHEAGKLKKFMELRKLGNLLITEAVDNQTGKRRDVVDLTMGEIYEIETDKRRAKRHEKGINVIMV